MKTLTAGSTAVNNLVTAAMNLSLKAQLYKVPRKAGGARFALYKVEGTEEEIATYKAIMDACPIKTQKGKSKLIIDDATGSPLFVFPSTEHGRTINLVWTSGDPKVNPAGSFTIDTMDADIAEDQAIAKARIAHAGLLRAQAAFGGSRLPQAPAPTASLSLEEVEAGMNAVAEDANPS